MVGLYHSRAQSMDRDTPSSNSRTKPSRTTSNDERHHQDLRKEKHDSEDSTRSKTKVGNTVNNHKENKLCEERNQERERDRRTEVRRRGRAKSPLEGSRVRISAKQINGGGAMDLMSSSCEEAQTRTGRLHILGPE
ncbi:hypothetical protein Dimus_029296, partial [Dionaea muscipula]